DGKFVTLRVPYPMGFYAKGMDGRIDDPNGGWKGRGVWAAFGNRTPFHVEGGKGNLPKVVHFQMRSSPLADCSRSHSEPDRDPPGECRAGFSCLPATFRKCLPRSAQYRPA